MLLLELDINTRFHKYFIRYKIILSFFVNISKLFFRTNLVVIRGVFIWSFYDLV